MPIFWRTDQQYARIKPHTQADTRGIARLDDRRMIFGIIHFLKSGCRQTDASYDQYNPYKILYSRFVCCCEKVVWEALLIPSAKQAVRRRGY